MSGIERDALTKAVRSAVLAPQKPSLSERFGRRFAPALGAAALFAIAVVALISLPSDDSTVSGGDGGDTSTTLESGGGSQDTTLEQKAPAPAAAPEADAATESEELTGGGAGGAASGQTSNRGSTSTTAGMAVGARGNFVLEPTRFAVTGLDLPALVPTRSPRQSVDAYGLSGTELAAGAPNEAVAQQILDCTEATIATSPHPLTPTSAVYYEDAVLVIGFVWLEESVSILNYELRGWVDGDCARVSPIYRRGQLE